MTLMSRKWICSEPIRAIRAIGGQNPPFQSGQIPLVKFAFGLCRQTSAVPSVANSSDYLRLIWTKPIRDICFIRG